MLKSYKRGSQNLIHPFRFFQRYFVFDATKLITMKRKQLLVLFITIMGIINANAQSRGPTPGEFY